MSQAKQQGFSLLEILIAFAILALSLSILLKIFSSGVNTAIVSEDYTAAVQIAEGLMVKTGTEFPLEISEKSGAENERYRWLLTITPYAFNPDDVDIKGLKVELLKVNIAVTWDDGNGSERLFELTKLKLANKLL